MVRIAVPLLLSMSDVYAATSVPPLVPDGSS
jgi:hypothetical protein